MVQWAVANEARAVLVVVEVKQEAMQEAKQEAKQEVVLQTKAKKTWSSPRE